MLQGRHGFASDNLVSARVVLADGSVKTVSENQHADLFWALRGAGHNFGIVTSFQVKVYETTEKWAMTVFSFTQDKLEAFFETWNALEKGGEDPGLLVLNGVLARNDALDKNYASSPQITKTHSKSVITNKTCSHLSISSSSTKATLSP